VIIGPGWGFLGLLAVGIAALVLVPGCGLLVVDRAPSGQGQLDAPPLVEVDARVEARAVTVPTVSPARVRNQVQRAALHVRNTTCDGIPTGSGFALDSKLLVAGRDVLPGGGWLKVAARNGVARKLETTHVYRLGAFSIAQVAGRLPHSLPLGQSLALGSSVAVLGYPVSSAPRVLPGVVVDEVSGAPFGVRGPVLRLTSVLRRGDAGGPVIDAKGRLIGVAFATDPRTGFTVAAPLSTLRSAVAKRKLEALPTCGGA
jgi:S1-C subfamily serine protease